jgi:putative Mg2+ transporter-C (MgtC) family protein
MEQIRAILRCLEEFNTVSCLLRILLAVAAGGVIGNERGRHGRAAGFRTHILVCLGGAMTALCSLYVSTVAGMGGDVFRIPAQVISGIGFLGAGIILVRNNNTVAGLTTAAGMWVTAIIGLAFGFGFYGGALLTTGICVLNATLFTRVEVNRLRAMRYYLEVRDVAEIQGVLEQVNALLPKDSFLETIPARSGLVGSVGFVITASNRGDSEELRQALARIDGVSFVVPG